MELYTINENYINYLRQFSKNVRYNKNESRPYVGVVLKVNEYDYFVPLGSPKPKHLTMKETTDFIKLDSGKLGILNINNMIPVPLEYVKLINFQNFDKYYSKLLLEQKRWLERNETLIKNKSKKLYTLITTKENTIFHKRSNNFKLLEEKALEYGKPKELIPHYNPLTGHQISLCPGEEEKLNKMAFSSSAWICKGDVKKHNIEIKENAVSVSVKVFSLSKEENKPCIKDITIYNVAHLNITKELSAAFKEPVKKEKQISISKNKNIEIER